jgi:hypothetical protein
VHVCSITESKCMLCISKWLTVPLLFMQVRVYNMLPPGLSFQSRMAAVQRLLPKGTRVAIVDPCLKRPDDDPSNVLGIHIDNPKEVGSLHALLRTPS